MTRMMNDRKLPMSSGRRGSVFPETVETKELGRVEGCGQMRDYPDTEQAVAADQRQGISKAKGQPLKSGYRY